MITISLPKVFADTPYKALPSQEKWRIVYEEPQERYLHLVLRITHQQFKSLADEEIEAMFEAEHERMCDQLEATLDFSNEKDENAYATFATKGNRSTRRYLLIQG